MISVVASYTTPIPTNQLPSYAGTKFVESLMVERKRMKAIRLFETSIIKWRKYEIIYEVRLMSRIN